VLNREFSRPKLETELTIRFKEIMILSSETPLGPRPKVEEYDS